ncbi:Protein involved in sex pheromone biosynthesis [Gracilibacillus ureilyticus]|uniref:Protein involved in sex pheromone biosynthesis n=1 Tax=Gracilibacillus ureilyticus TaxID=531814 RepID=A0A1H9QVP0_9BACI|nr:CamS family sex pheromone protein [Gracilibacillus ureilyticus]SER64500.1 Protein involved in sex pheromone biosynthesis [Gracilibacillus ureilyticus]
MKQGRYVLLIFILLLTACAPDFGQSPEETVIDENQDETQQETAIIPKYNLSEENYRVLIDSNLSKARGVITNQIANRVDIDELEEGLRRHSTEVYDPESYYFQEGQYLTEDILYSWLERYDEETDPLGLNPEINGTENPVEDEKANPKYLSHILEQNYLTKSEDDVMELAGISIGIAMKSVYRFQTEIGGPYYYENIPENEMMKEANELAGEIVARIRQTEGLGDVPIMLAIYREASQSSLVPGNFVAKTNIPGDSSSVGDWQELNEEYVLFPSESGQNTYPETWATIVDFEADISNYFPNYVSVIGKGFFRDGQLNNLTIDIPVSFYGKAELIGFTQYVYGLVISAFPNDFNLEINITSGDKVEALIVRDAGAEEGFVHIYN